MEILLIEPSKVQQTIISKVLREYSSHIILATSSDEAFEILDNRDPDLICASYILSDINSIEFCKLVRANTRKKHIPIIMLSSEKNDELYSNAIICGMTEVIKKSNLSELNDYLKNIQKQEKKDFLLGNILYVEDSRTFARIIKSYFEGTNINLIHFPDPLDAYDYFLKNEIDLVITDIVLEGQVSGLGLLRMIRSAEGKKAIVPVLVMTGFDDVARRIEIYKAGGNDYVLKPVFKEEFMARVHNLLTNKKLMDKVEEQNIKLEEISLRDPLTNISNRRFIMEIMPQKLSEAMTHNFNLSIIMTDIDHFKKVNDTYGHLTGDFVLKAVAGLLSANSKKEDIVARYGGEEFLLVLTHCNQDVAVEKAENLRKQIEALHPENINVTMSFGISTLANYSDSNLEELIGFADKALYYAKNKGRNRVEVYNSALMG
jgi:two-component system cell cycle response regulator